jgi:hypothetical protein
LDHLIQRGHSHLWRRTRRRGCGKPSHFSNRVG